MAVLVPDNGEGDALSYFVNKTAPENLILCLFNNNIVPAETDTTATYVEPVGFGYAPVTFTGAEWNILEGAPSFAAGNTVNFTFTGAAGNIYGYFFKRAVSGRLAYVERFTDGPYNILVSGDIVQVGAKITLD